MALSPQSPFKTRVETGTAAVLNFRLKTLAQSGNSRRKQWRDANTLPRIEVSTRHGVWLGITSIQPVPSAHDVPGECNEVCLDFRRAGRLCQPEQRSSRPVPPLQQL